MPVPLRIRQVQITPLAIPLRLRFEHAAASRATADPILVRLTAEAPYDAVGHGETLAREYVTGESTDTVLDDLVQFFVPLLLDFRADSFPAALEFAEQLPTLVEGRVVHAARAAVELALIDLAGRAFHRRASEAATWLGLPGFGAPGALRVARYSGMAVGRRPQRLRPFLRLQRLYGLRDFKLKVATDGWEQRLRDVERVLGPAIRRGRATLRVDANGAWSLRQALDALPLIEACGAAALEQPMRPLNDAQLPELARVSACDLVADESLVTFEDAERLVHDCGVTVLNVRIAKNGGLLPALRIAHRALALGADVQLGCLVGETSVLSAAGVAFLEACPRVRFVEGAFGRFLLTRDIAFRPVRFGYRGRIAPRAGFGLGVDVLPDAVQALAARPPITTNL